MKRIIIATGLAFLTALGASAQGRGRAQNMRGLPPSSSSVRGNQSSAGTLHSNGPGSRDRDKGRDRAADVGKGHKKGLNKQHSVRR
jgi:hypothetical protein